MKIPEDLKMRYQQAVKYPNDYEGSAPYYTRTMRELIERIAALEAKLAALEWTEITPENLPKVGDELGGWELNSELRPDMRPWRTRGHSSFTPCADAAWLNKLGWTHFRPITPPSRGSEAL